MLIRFIMKYEVRLAQWIERGISNEAMRDRIPSEQFRFLEFFFLRVVIITTYVVIITKHVVIIIKKLLIRRSSSRSEFRFFWRSNLS